MANVARRDWTREELVRALALYAVLPFGKFHRRNPEVVALAATIGRTPGAVATKLCNLASLDPEEAARGIAGLPNTSELDRAVWEEHYGQWEKLADELAPLPDDDLFEPAEIRIPSGPTSVSRVLKVRRGQQFFKRAVFGAYESTCCITGISEPRLLRASHILAWSKSEEHRLNPRNGLCLNALHDAAFDRGLLTVDSQMRVVLSPTLRRFMPSDVFESDFGRFERQPLRMPTRFRPDPALLEAHRGTLVRA